MRIRLYFDEDSMRRSLIKALRLRNVDVVTPAEEGNLERSDAEQLDWATTHGRVIFSSNCGDFCQLHSEYLNSGRHHAGIILVQQNRFSIGEQLRGCLRLVSAKSAEVMRDQLHFLSVRD